MEEKEIMKEINGVIKILQEKPVKKNKIEILKKEDNLEIADIIRELKISAKYNIFDLEATRRENSYLRNMLEDNSL